MFWEYFLTPDFFHTILRVCTPLLYAALGALLCEKSGVLHIGIEGVMLFSAFFGVVFSAYTQNLFWGLTGGIAAGVFLSLVLIYFIDRMKADAVLIGMAANIFASGSTIFLLNMLTGDKGLSASLKSLTVPNISLPFLGEYFSGHNALTYALIPVMIFTYFLLYRSPFGLRLRALGENKKAALSVGIKIHTMYAWIFAISGVYCALGGLYLSMAYVSWFSRDMTAGRGFIAMASCTLGGARLIGTGMAVALFAIAESAALSLQALSFPSELIQMTPYLAALIGLVVYAKRKAQQR